MLPTQRLHERFTQVAAGHADRIAVTAPDGELTYAELDARSDAVAVGLIERGVAPCERVGLSCGRGTALIVGMLGILKAGVAYVPIDPDYPGSRIAFLVGDSRARIVLADEAGFAALDGIDVDVVSVAELAARPMRDAIVPRGCVADVAYVIYTSGSTGTPKGVQVTHGNAVRLFDSTAGGFAFDETDVWTMFHSPSFDFSVWEIWGALLHGGRLCIVAPEVVANPMLLLALLRDEGVTVLNQTPSAFRMLSTAACAGPPAELELRAVVFGGERLDVAMLRDWITAYGDDHPKLINMYGITETTVHVTYRRIVEADLERPDRSPVGRPIPDLSVTLHDEQGRCVADGTPGEMWVSGAGVALGYLNRPELNAERFCTRGGVRFYRSGDLGVYEGGELVHCGRIDDQIKVRGFRIEPFEVEAALLDHPGVRSAVVTSKDFGDGDVRLVAFVVWTGPAPHDAVDDLRAHTQRLLPRHLWPSDYTLVTDIPLTAQGKVDRRALLEPGRDLVAAAV